MHTPRILVVWCLVALAAAAMLGTAQAQVGARAMGMGGAFVGVADDAEAVFYNPAGIALQPCGQATLTVAANNNSTVGVQDFFAITTPFDEHSTIGFGYSRTLLASLGSDDPITRRLLDSLNVYEPEALGRAGISEELGPLSELQWKEDQYWLAGAYRYDCGVCVGVNVRWTKDDFTLAETGVLVAPARSRGAAAASLPLSAGIDTNVGVDLGLLYSPAPNARLGLMVRNINEPDQSIMVGDETLDGVLRRTYDLGLSVINPGGGVPGMLVSAEVSDLSDELNRAFRFGLEQRTKRGCYTYAWRAGWYGDYSAVTVGAGLWFKQWQLDVAYLHPENIDNMWLVSAGLTF